MIKYHVNRKNKIRVAVDGTPKELMKQTAILVSLVYNSIKKVSPEAAENFKTDLLTLLLPADSPVWKEDAPK